MSWFRPKYSSPAVEDALLKAHFIEYNERIVRHDSDVSKRRKAVQEILQTARAVRACLDEVSPASLLLYSMASPEDRLELEDKTEVGKLSKQIRRALRALYPATRDADAEVRASAYTGMTDVYGKDMLKPEVLASDLAAGMDDAEASVRAAVAASLGDCITFWANSPEAAGSAVGTLVDHLEDSDPLVREAVFSALRHGLAGIPPETLAARLAEGVEWQRAVEATRQPTEAAPGQNSPPISKPGPVEETPSFTGPVETLLAIYAANPDGFAPGYGNPAERERVRQVGEALNRVGGMALMLNIHTEFARRCPVQGAARNLEHTWDRIGDWLG